jgi:hypothetical protein
MKKNTILTLAVVAIISMGAMANAAVITIYTDDFSGLSTTNLNGQPPDTRPSTETWASSTTQFTNWKADGSIAAGNTGNPDSLSNAFLPFEPEAGTVYTLSADLNITNGGDWFALGFASTNTTTNNFFSNSTGDGSPWMLLRGAPDNGNWIVTFPGPGAGDGENSIENGPSVSIVLDTTGTDWVAKFYSGADLLRTYTYTGVDISDDINYVGFGRFTSAAGNVDNFALTQVPEPATMTLLALGGIALIRRRRRA